LLLAPVLIPCVHWEINLHLWILKRVQVIVDIPLGNNKRSDFLGLGWYVIQPNVEDLSQWQVVSTGVVKLRSVKHYHCR